MTIVGLSWITLRNNSWSDPSIWSCGRLPTASDDVVIASGYTLLLDSTMAEAVCRNLEILGTFSVRRGSIAIHDNRIVVDQESVFTK